MKTSAVSTAVLLACLTAMPASADEVSRWRLFVSDHAKPVVRAIDPATGKVEESFATAGPASLYRTASGRAVFAVQGKADTVSIIATGIAFNDHGDHGDIRVEPPRLLPLTVKGARPSHFVEHHGDIALFFDGEGLSRNLGETAVLKGKGKVREFRTAAPHHGVSVAWGRHTILSEPNAAQPEELPVGLQVLDETGAKVGAVHACPDLHGEASSGNMLAVACASGLLLVENGADGPMIRHLPYGASLPEGKATTLIGGKGLQYFLGNYGPDRLVIVEPAEAEPFRLVDLPTRRVHFATDPVRPRFAYVFTEDGRLHRLDIVAGRIDKSLGLTEPYSMDGHWSDPRPRVAVAGDAIFVSDPLKGRIHTVDTASFAPSMPIAVEGRPFNLVAVGGSGTAHAAAQ